MPLFIGTSAPVDIRIGETPVQRLYLGSGLIWNRAPPPPPLVVSVSKTAVTGTGLAGPVTATASGGTPPWSFQWQRISGSPSFRASHPAAATTSFYHSTHTASGVSHWHCVVTDASAHTATSPGVQAAVFNVAPPGTPGGNPHE